jgi:hypothetical protein
MIPLHQHWDKHSQAGSELDPRSKGCEFESHLTLDVKHSNQSKKCQLLYQIVVHS